MSAKDSTEPSEIENRYRSLLDHASDIIYTHDLRGTYTSFNEAVERVAGYTREEAVGLSYTQIIAPEYLELARQMVERKLRGEEMTAYELEIIAKDGSRIPLEICSQLVYRDGKPVEVLGIARDIKDRKQSEAEREQLLLSEQQARASAEESLRLQLSVEERLRTLVDASESLLGSPKVGAVLPAVLNLSRRLISADGYAIWRYSTSKSRWEIVAAEGVSEEFKAMQIPVTNLTPTMPDMPLVMEDVFSTAIVSDRLELYRKEGVKSLLAVPLKLHGQIVGTLVFYYRQAHHFNETEISVATALTNLSASAIGTAELYEEQSRLRALAEVAEHRALFLAEATTVLASSLDYETTLESVARLAVPHVADWCSVDTVDESGKARRLAVAHVDPAKVEWARELGRRYPAEPDAPRGVPNVLRTGKPELYAEIPDSLLVASAKDEQHLYMLREMGFTSAMVVPLRAHDRVLGAITFVTAESGRHYTATDLTLAEDLAHRAALAVDNAHLYRNAQEANRLKDEFLAMLSHELRTPLTAIIGWTHLLRRGKLTADQSANALEIIERNARAQEQLVIDLLDVSRIVTGKLRLEVSIVDLISVIDASVESLKPAASAKEIRLQTFLDPQAAVVSGDADRLQQVVWNLLSNAIKFTYKGGLVRVRLKGINSHVEISVSDTGQGIAADFLPHVFDRFRQADQTTTRVYGGLGLGLGIARHLVELHGGTVEAFSEGEGQGATFTIKLPRANSQAETEESQPQGPEKVYSTADGPSLEGLHVLVVDDDEDTCELMAVILQKRGAAVLTATSVREALEAMQHEKFDVLISDIGMPVEDGYALIQKVRSLPADKGGTIPAAALTAYAREEDRIRALLAGFQIHIPKPINPAELVAVVANLAGRTGTA